MRRCIKIRSCERFSWTEAHFRDTSHTGHCTATDRTFHQPLSPCTSASPASSLCVSPHSLLLYTPSKVFTLIPSIKLSSFLAVLPSRTRPVPIPLPPGFRLFRLVSPFLCSAFHIRSHTPSGRHQKTPFASPFAASPTNASRDSRTTLVALARQRKALWRSVIEPHSIVG